MVAALGVLLGATETALESINQAAATPLYIKSGVETIGDIRAVWPAVVAFAQSLDIKLIQLCRSGSGAYNPRMSKAPQVGVVMGSSSDFEVMRSATDLLNELSVSFEARVISAHRTPDLLFSYADAAYGRGFKVIIAGAGGAAHLPGMLAAKSLLPVLGVPIPATILNGLDSLLSIVQMPRGVPVATLAIGKPGAANAALLAAQILSLSDPDLHDRLQQWRAQRTQEVLAQELPL